MKCMTALCAIVLGTSGAAAQYIGPTTYSSFADSPFSGLNFGYFHLEDFEDGALNAPGVSASAGGVLGPGSETDSVDGDDGVIDGNGNAGSSWYSTGGVREIRFTFNLTTLGAYPTHAGLVWTDVGNTDSALGISDVVFTAFDGNGNSLGAFGPFTLGDGDVHGQSAEDRFFGIVNPAGISTIRIEMPASGDWEVDHVQFGLVPSPGSISIALLALCGARHRRR